MRELFLLKVSFEINLQLYNDLLLREVFISWVRHTHSHCHLNRFQLLSLVLRFWEESHRPSSCDIYWNGRLSLFYGNSHSLYLKTAYSRKEETNTRRHPRDEKKIGLSSLSVSYTQGTVYLLYASFAWVIPGRRDSRWLKKLQRRKHTKKKGEMELKVKWNDSEIRWRGERRVKTILQRQWGLHDKHRDWCNGKTWMNHVLKGGTCIILESFLVASLLFSLIFFRKQIDWVIKYSPFQILWSYCRVPSLIMNLFDESCRWTLLQTYDCFSCLAGKSPSNKDKCETAD